VGASPYAEQIVTIALVLLGVCLVGFARRRPGGPSEFGRWEAWLSFRRELTLLLTILVSAILMRTVGWSRGLTPPFWFSEKPTLEVAEALNEGTVWRHWVESFRNYQVGFDYYSVVMMPLLVGIQWLLGPRFHLPVLTGAVWGVAAVALAWALGRTVHSKTFGLLFAAIVAISPLQLMWSRLGGIPIRCVPHVLLVMLLGYVAGKHASPILVIAAGVMTWATLYQYYAARVAIPLAVAALCAGLQTARRTFLRTGLVLAVFVLTLAAIYALLAPNTEVTRALWPQFPGYVGNKGERTLGE